MKKKILVVDDDPTSLKIVTSLLRSQGYDVFPSSEAVDIEKLARDFNTDLILMDLIMPNVGGNQAVEKLHKNPALRSIPVVFLTAMQMKDEERGFEFEVNVDNKSYRTLTKPFNAKELVAEIAICYNNTHFNDGLLF